MGPGFIIALGIVVESRFELPAQTETDEGQDLDCAEKPQVLQ